MHQNGGHQRPTSINTDPLSSSSNSGTIRRSVRSRTESGTMSMFRISRHFKNALGLGGETAENDGPQQDDEKSIVSFSMDPDSQISSQISSPMPDEDEIESVNDPFRFGLKPIQVYYRSKTPILVKVLRNLSVQDVVSTILNTLFPDQENRPNEWMLYKVDRNQLVTRIWLQQDQSLNFYKINDGDELIIKNIEELEKLQYTMPPDKNQYTLQFGFSETVKELVDHLCQIHQLPTGVRYGFFYKRLGIWLDERRPMMLFEIDSEHILELRQISQEFLVRVQIPDFDTRFTLKVIPSLYVSDLINMIHNNLTSKRLHLNTFYRGGSESSQHSDSVEKTIHYGLYSTSKKQWLQDYLLLSDYGLEKIHEELQYRIQYQPVSIELYDQQKIQLFTTEMTKIEDLLEMISLDYSNLNDSITALRDANGSYQFGLFTKGMELLKPDDLVWNILKDLTKAECLLYRIRKWKLFLSTTLEEGKVEVEVDPLMSLEVSLPLFWRKFGVSGQMTFRGLKISGAQDYLDLKKSLINQRVREETLLQMDLVINTSKNETINETDQLNIWLEKEDNPENITFSSSNDGTVTAATLNKLIEKLTLGSEETGNYLDFMKTFLLTYQSFTTSFIFLQKLIERYHVPRQLQSFPKFADFDKFRLKVQLRVCNVLQQWTKRHPYDFLDFFPKRQEINHQNVTNKKLLIHLILEFAQQILVQDHPVLARQIRKNILRISENTLKNLYSNSRQSQTVKFVSPPASKVPIKNAHIVFSWEADEIARQLTLMEFELFSTIQPVEFLSQAWTKSDANIRAPNILAVTKKFNQIALWVVKSILEVKTVRQRAKRFAKLIDVAGILYTLNNFATLMAFVAGFNKAPVTRLKHTMKEMPSKSLKKLQELESIMSAEGSYKNYRSKLHSVNPPCIPYVGVYLLDLTYMEDGNPNKIQNLINFSKRKLIYVLIREFQQYQDQLFQLRPVDDLLQLLEQVLSLDIAENEEQAKEGRRTMKAYEDYLFELSLQREPRGAERFQVE